MCLFRILVLVPEHTADIETEISHRMLPYSWHREVPLWDAPCHCQGKQAESSARVQTIAQLGTLETYKLAFQQVLDAHEVTEDEDDSLILWNSYIESYGRTERDFYNKHPLRNAPDPDCHFCQGTGLRRSVKNGNAKWDKYELMDVLPVTEALERGQLFLTMVGPQGIVTRHGWTDLGDISPLTKTPVLRKDWYAVALKMLKGYPNDILGIVACEI